MAIELPANWANYQPADKIDYFNQAGITPAQLLGEGVPASDINWMLNNGYTAGGAPVAAPAPAPVTDVDRTQVQATSPVNTGLTFDLPQGWENFNPGQKIAYFNQANITPTDLRNVGVPESDITWMKTQGYTAGTPAPVVPPTTTVNIPGTVTPPVTQPVTRPVTSVTAPPVTSVPGYTLPTGWTGFTPAEKIAWFNANNVKPSQLTAAGVPASDLNYMIGNGYTAGRPFAGATQGFEQNFQNYTSIPIGAQYNPNVTAFGESPYSQLRTQMQPLGNPYATFESGTPMGGYDPGLYTKILRNSEEEATKRRLASAGLINYVGNVGGDGSTSAGGDSTGNAAASAAAAGSSAGAAGGAGGVGIGEGGGTGMGGWAKGGLIDRVAGPNPPGPDDGAGMLDVGEYVIKKSSVNKYGKGLLDMINDGKIPAKKMKSLLG